MAEAANIAVVQRYFAEVLDGGTPGVMAELFAVGALQHFPGRTLTFSGAPPAPAFAEREFRTTVHHIVAEGELVVAHLTHTVRFGSPAVYQTRAGPVDVSGRDVHWHAMALFRFQNGKIVEEWVSRDELDILMQLGAVQVATAG